MSTGARGLSRPMFSALALVLLTLLLSPAARAGFLDTDCSSPKANGGLGFCGPSEVSL